MPFPRIGAEFHVRTSHPRAETDEACRAIEPWRMRVQFDNGTDTATFRTYEPFNAFPLRKLDLLSRNVDFERFRGGRVLDVGCNAGYNSLCMAQRFACDVTGIDNDEANLTKARTITRLAGNAGNLDFQIADANAYRRDGEFDLIIHFGTLYHLHDIVSSLRNMARSLKPGGRFLLETITHHGADEYECRFIHGLNGDRSNYWAPSKRTIGHLLGEEGVEPEVEYRDFDIGLLEGTTMKRSIAGFRKRD